MKKQVILGLYGVSNIGKTSLIQKLIERLTKDDYKIATIKKTNKKIGIDKKGKDTWKHTSAGAKLVVLSSPVETDLIIKNNINENQIIQQINSIGMFDFIFIEGASSKNIKKIRIGDITLRENTLFTYNNDFEGFIKRIKNMLYMQNKDNEEIIIKVNGKNIPLTDFPSEIIKNSIIGMIQTLRGVEEIKDAEIKIKL
jgi:molybdopterin-guanine dinucleotide biosynthesis protein B